MNTLFSLVAKLGLDTSEYERGLNNASKEMDKFGDKVEESGQRAQVAADGGYTIFKNVIANLTTNVILKAVEAVSQLTEKIVGIGKQSFSAFAEYEQLVGGVQTLYKESADKLIENAEKAYKTSGISANKYMEQATSFAAILLSGLEGDTNAAVDYADMAIRDMSDNANKMGTNIQSIQNAYMGFAKMNFTMLDNLKIGYGGTKTEMARLINETGVLGDTLVTVGKQGNFDQVVTMDKMIEAIHIVQQQLGITGTTALEAEGTITGSMGQVKAAFQNLLVAIADGNQDVRSKTGIVVTTIETMIKNSVPRIKQIITGLWKSITTALRKYAPEVANKVLPVIKKIGDAIKNMFDFVIKNGDTIITVIKGIGVALLTFKAFTLIQSAATALSGLLTFTNPLGLLTIAVSGLVGLFVALKDAGSKLSAEEEAWRAAVAELNDKVDDQAESWRSAKKAREEYLGEQTSELNHAEALWKELQKITAENGKIKEGYEARAKFIATELGKSTGIEIEIIDGVIQKYDELGTAIDDAIKKRRAEALLNAQYEMYQKAIKERDANKSLYDEAYTKAMQAQVKLSRAQEELDAVYAESQALKDAGGAWLHPIKAIVQGNKEREALRKYNDIAKEYNSLVESYREAKSTMEEYNFAIAQYEQNATYMQAGEYEKMTNQTWAYIDEMKKAGKERADVLEAQFYQEQLAYEVLLEQQKNASDGFYDTLVEDAKRKLGEIEAEWDKALGIYGKQAGRYYSLAEEVKKASAPPSISNAALNDVQSEFTSMSDLEARRRNYVFANLKSDRDQLTKADSGVTINVYGAEGQNVSQLADIVSEKIKRDVGQGNRVWK